MSAAEQLPAHDLDVTIEELHEIEHRRQAICAALKAELDGINRCRFIDNDMAAARLLLLEQLEAAEYGRLIDDREGMFNHIVVRDIAGTELKTATKGFDGTMGRESIRIENDQFAVIRSAQRKRILGQDPTLTVKTISMGLDHIVGTTDVFASASPTGRPKRVVNGTSKFELTLSRLIGRETLEVASPEDLTVAQLTANFTARMDRALGQCVRETTQIRERYLD